MNQEQNQDYFRQIVAKTQVAPAMIKFCLVNNQAKDAALWALSLERYNTLLGIFFMTEILSQEMFKRKFVPVKRLGMMTRDGIERWEGYFEENGI